MSEPMGLEHLTELLAQLKGYHTSTRVPFVARLTKAGEKKEDNAQGDLDVVGLGPEKDLHDGRRRLLVAECKGYGSPESYPCWLVPRFLCHIEDMVWGAARNVASVSDERWKSEFESRGSKPTDCWVVFPGHFMPSKNRPKGWGKVHEAYHEFIKPMRVEAERVWEERSDASAREAEAGLLAQAEALLSSEYGVRVRLLPVHVLIEELITAVSSDMLSRRKRYPSPAAELLRWTIRATRNGVLDLGKIEDRLVGKEPS